MRTKRWKTELRVSRWGLDMFVCSSSAIGVYLYLVWVTRFFELSPFEPSRLAKGTLAIVFGYTLSVFFGLMFKKTTWPSWLWVSIVGAALFELTRIVIALPYSIEYYNKFTPSPSLFDYLFERFFGRFISVTILLSVVAIAVSVLARGMISVVRNSQDAE